MKLKTDRPKIHLVRDAVTCLTTYHGEDSSRVGQSGVAALHRPSTRLSKRSTCRPFAPYRASPFHASSPRASPAAATAFTLPSPSPPPLASFCLGDPSAHRECTPASRPSCSPLFVPLPSCKAILIAAIASTVAVRPGLPQMPLTFSSCDGARVWSIAPSTVGFFHHFYSSPPRD